MTDPAEFYMPFGRHKGKPLADVPTPYLRWLLAEAKDLRTDTRETIEAFIGNPGQRGKRAPKGDWSEVPSVATCARCGHPGSGHAPADAPRLF